MSAILSPIQEREPVRLAVVEGPPPATRGDCIDGPRPCPWACRYRLESDRESCALDVASHGGVTLDEVGEILGYTRERIRQIEATALRKLNRRLKVLGVDSPFDGPGVTRGVAEKAPTGARLRAAARVVPMTPQRAAREELGLSLRSLAARVGVTPVALSRYERGESRLTDDVEERLAGLLGEG